MKSPRPKPVWPLRLVSAVIATHDEAGAIAGTVADGFGRGVTRGMDSSRGDVVAIMMADDCPMVELPMKTKGRAGVTMGSRYRPVCSCCN